MTTLPPMPNAVGIVWYRPEDYEQFKAMFVDKGYLPDQFDDWHNYALEVREEWQQMGIVVEKVYLDLLEFPKWCQMRGLPMNSQARQLFSVEYVALKHWDVGETAYLA